MSRPLAILALIAGAWAPGASAQVLLSKQCQTMWQGHPVRGMYQIERQVYYDTHRVYGNFRDDQNNLIEFEIMTNQPQGVGGMWFNNARHREIHVRWQMLPDGGFVITGEDGAAARYSCR
jgi:hypothetical protein